MIKEKGKEISVSTKEGGSSVEEKIRGEKGAKKYPR